MNNEAVEKAKARIFWDISKTQQNPPFLTTAKWEIGNEIWQVPGPGYYVDADKPKLNF